MDGWDLYYECVDRELGRQMERHLHLFRESLEWWLYAELNWPSRDWETQLQYLVDHTRYYGLEIHPVSIQSLHNLVEARVNGTGPFESLGPYCWDAPAVATDTPIQLAVAVGLDDGTRTDTTLALNAKHDQPSEQPIRVSNDGATKKPGGAIIRPGDLAARPDFEGDQAVWANVLDRERTRHFGYTYYRPARLEQFFGRLLEATRHINFRADASTTAVASYQGLFNRINYRGRLQNVSGLTAVHETIHAATDFAGIYTWNEEKDEALAWTAQIMLGFAAGKLRAFEDAIKDGTLASARDAQNAWEQLWHPSFGVPGVIGFMISWNKGSNSRAITNADVIDVQEKLGIQMSATSLKPAYEQLLRKHGISIRLQNRADLPEAFR